MLVEECKEADEQRQKAITLFLTVEDHERLEAIVAKVGKTVGSKATFARELLHRNLFEFATLMGLLDEDGSIIGSDKQKLATKMNQSKCSQETK